MRRTLALFVSLVLLFALLGLETLAVLPSDYSCEEKVVHADEVTRHTHTWNTFACSGWWAAANWTPQTCNLYVSGCTYTENLYYTALRCLECGEYCYNNPNYTHPEVRYHSICGTKRACAWDGTVMSYDVFN